MTERSCRTCKHSRDLFMSDWKPQRQRETAKAKADALEPWEKVDGIKSYEVWCETMREKCEQK